jgi:hypothetical protein
MEEEENKERYIVSRHKIRPFTPIHTTLYDKEPIRELTIQRDPGHAIY